MRREVLIGGKPLYESMRKSVDRIVILPKPLELPVLEQWPTADEISAELDKTKPRGTTTDLRMERHKLTYAPADKDVWVNREVAPTEDHDSLTPTDITT